MKTVLKILLFVSGAILLAAAGIYFFVMRPGQILIENNRADLVMKANKFAECFLKEPVEKCEVSPRFLESAQRENIQKLATKIKQTLGDRVSAVPIDSSFSFKTYAGTDGANISIKFRLRAYYVHDQQAIEEYSFYKNGKSPFLVERFFVSSRKFLE